jgi:hypothetical protein
MFLMRILLSEEKAVSVALKYAESNSISAIKMPSHILLSITDHPFVLIRARAIPAGVIVQRFIDS